MYMSYIDHFGKGNFQVVYKIAADGVRLKRYLEREEYNDSAYNEIVRRNRTDDYDHAWFFKEVYKQQSGMTIVVGDIDPSKYLSALIEQTKNYDPCINIFFEYKGEIQHYQFIPNNGKDFKYYERDNRLVIGRILIDMCTATAEVGVI